MLLTGAPLELNLTTVKGSFFNFTCEMTSIYNNAPTCPKEGKVKNIVHRAMSGASSENKSPERA
jgi:hypothetical protein